MRWYSVQLLFRSVHPEKPGDDRLWEERIVMFSGESEQDVAAKAEVYGKSEEHEYTGGEGDLVRWQFERVGEVCDVEASTFADGVEVFSRFLRTDEVESMSKPFEDKA